MAWPIWRVRVTRRRLVSTRRNIYEEFFDEYIKAASAPEALILACEQYMEYNPNRPINRVEIIRDDET